MKKFIIRSAQVACLGVLILSCRDSGNESAITPTTHSIEIPLTASALANDKDYLALQTLSKDFSRFISKAIQHLSKAELAKLRQSKDYTNDAIAFLNSHESVSFTNYQLALNSALAKVTTKYSFNKVSTASLTTLVEQANQTIADNDRPTVTTFGSTPGSGNGSGGFNGGGDQSGSHDGDPPQNFDEGNGPGEGGVPEEHGFASAGYSICLGGASIAYLGAIATCNATTANGSTDQNNCLVAAGIGYTTAIAVCSYTAALNGF